MTEGTIKRRRRAAPEPIAEGERRNVTFLADAKTYNFLVETARQSGRSISDLLAIHLNKNLPAKLVPKFEDVFFGTPESMEMLKNYAMIFSACAQGKDWREDELARAMIRGAFSALNRSQLPFDDSSLWAKERAYDPYAAEIRAAWGAGRQLGELLAGPLRSVVSDSFDADKSTDPENKS